MPFRREQFVNEEIYHIVVRGIDNNLIFKDIDDYYRGIFSIYEFNNGNSVSITKRRRDIRKAKENMKLGQARVLTSSFDLIDNRDKLIEILAFCFMPNHIHLLLKQVQENGISVFMQKLNGGYGRYFNIKYKRKGYVFQNRFVSVIIKTNDQLKIVFVYVHTNPVSLIEPKWKEIGIKNYDNVIQFLEEKYRWSSYFDYINKKNFPSVTERNFMFETMGGEEGSKDSIYNWIKYKNEFTEFPDLKLE